jgi:quercetin dioxygenase-like cupin family protein
MSQITTWDEFPAREYVPNVFIQAVAGQKVMMTRITYKGQVTIPPHQHEAEQVMLMVQGRLWARVGDEEKEVGPGAILVVNSNVIHGFRKLSEEDVVFHECFAPIRLEYLIGYKGPDPALAMIKQGLEGTGK